MGKHSHFSQSSFHVMVLLLVGVGATHAQVTGPQRRITEAVDETKLTRLAGNTHPLARAEFDRGVAPLSLPMERMLLVLKRGADQETTLEALLEQQQDKSSPNYHQWLTPEQFGHQFGPSDADIQTVTSWLQSHGFSVARVSNGRTVIEFSGTHAQVQEAFHTSIHKYTVGGEDHWANASDPQIPTALAPVVAGIDTLHNFPRQAMHQLAGVMSRSPSTGELTAAGSLFNLGGNCGVQGVGCHGVSPYDFATIYDVSPLWNAAPTKIDGTGQTIAIVSESNMNIQDVRDFRNYFGLPAKDPTIVVNGPDPGLNGAEIEADLDVEWAGAVAPNAAIILVVSQSTEVSLGADLAAEYAVNNNVAPILNVSYGICEAALGTAGNQFFNQLWQQAAAQGITVTVATGDSGSAVCDRRSGNPPLPAQFGLQVSGFSSTPYNVAVGGTDFNDLTNIGTYWNPSNSTPPGNPSAPATVSAKSYIPETTWNISCTNSVFGDLLGFSKDAETNCNNPQLANFVRAAGASGGKSVCTTGTGQDVTSCGGGYPKPSWQTALTPSDGKRDVPDVSLFSSVASPSGSFYVICEADRISPGYTSCNATDPNTQFLGIGGTSASAPSFAGIMALVAQKTGSRQGNANYILYKLSGESGASCDSSNGAGTNCVFYDVTNGTIAMPCAAGSPNCNVTHAGDQYGILSGYATTTGYDLATGLGSVNAANLVNKWTAVSLTPSSTSLSLTPPSGGSLSNLTHGQPVGVSIGVTGSGGPPTGNVSLIANTGPNGTEGVQGFVLSSGSASGTTNALPGGTYNVVAQYAGDGTFGSSTSTPPVSVTVAPEASKLTAVLELFDPATGKQTNGNATSAAYGSLELLRMNVTSQSGDVCAQNAPGQLGCPTGSVTITNNGVALDAGTYALNSEGYAEDQTIQLPGGTNALKLTYTGDSSYSASAGADTVTVTPAPTTTKAIFNPVVQTLVIGGPSAINGMTNSQSLGAAPTGNFAVLDGSTVVGTSTVLGFPGSSSRGANCQALINFSIGPPSGQHTLTVQYSGDQNYSGSTSAPVTVNAVYPTSTAAAANPTNVVYPNSVTLTATVSTGNPASNAALKPTGTVSISSSYGPISPVTTTVTQDASGNWMLQATATTTPQQSEYISANYSGDSNYASSSSQSIVYLTVTIPDFGISANPAALTITAGQTGTTTLTITPLTSYSSTVALTCAGVGYVIPGTTCTFAPSSATLSNGTPAKVNLSIATIAPSSGTSALTAPNWMRDVPEIPSGRGTSWTLAVLSGLAAILLAALPGRRRYLYGVVGLWLLCGLSFAVGCGGGGGNGGGGGVQPGLAQTTTTVSTPSTKVAPGVQPTLTATVSSSKPVTGTVTFSSQTCGFSAQVGLTNGMAQIQIAPGVATCVVTAQYGGDPNNQPSQSGNLSIVFTGTAAETVSGNTSADVHTLPVSVTLQ